MKNKLIEKLLSVGLLCSNGKVNPNIKKMLVKHKSIIDQVVTHTASLPSDATIVERIFCLRNNLVKRPLCVCGEERLYSGNAKYNKTCGDKNCIETLRHQEKVYTKIQIKRQIVMNQINPITGLNAFQEMYQKSHETKISKGLHLPDEARSDFEKYRSTVWKITMKNDLSKLENFNWRGLAGVDGAYHIDHIFSILDGFNNSVSPEIIGHISNIRMIPWKDNLTKSSRSEITIEELVARTQAIC